MAMRLLALSSLRYLLRHPWEVLLTALGVALGVGVVVSIDLAIQSSREAFRLSTETVAGRATHQIIGSGGGLPDSLFRAVRVELGVRSSAPVVEGIAVSPGLPGRPLTVLGVDPFSEASFRPVLLGGSSGLDVTALLAGGLGVFLSRETASNAGLTAGDTLVLLVEGRRKEVELRGILEPADELSRRGLRDFLFMDVSGAQELLGKEGRLDRIDLILPSGPEGEAEVRALEAHLPAGARVEETGRRAAGLSQMISAFDLNLQALSLLALIFGMFLIYNTLTFSVVRRRPLLGALRSLGVTRREVMGLVMGEALVVGTVGTALGLVVGVGLGRGMVGLVTQTINDLYFVLSVQGLAVPPGVLVKGGVMGGSATLLAALPPALEASLAPPRLTQIRSVLEERARRAVPQAGALGGGLLAAGGVLLLLPSRSVLLSFAGLFGVVMGLALLTPLTTALLMGMAAPVANRTVGILGAMAARGVVAAMSRTAPAMAALVVAVSVSVGLGTMISSFRETVSDWLDSTLQADIYVSVPGLVSSRAQGTLDPAVVGRLSRAPGIVGFSSYRDVVVETPQAPVRVIALDLDPRGEAAFSFLAGGGAEGFEAFRREGGVFLSEPLAYRTGLSVGNRILLPTDLGPRAFQVAGIFYDYGSEQGVVMMSRDAYEASWRDRGITSLGLFIAGGAKVDGVVGELRSLAGEAQALSIRSNRALKAASLEIFDRTFAITGVLRLLALSVAFIGVLSALMALQLERGRELGVLRANGLTPGQVWKLVTTQTGIMGLLAGVLAVPAGLILAAVMVFVVNKRSFGWTLRLELGPEILLQAVLLSVAGALLAGVLPAWRMSRTSPARALREE
ncbi:MAG: FtsX-like permease family protein [Gemmatimonadota bacterium]|jgi:putative ABC transport system permease protein